MAHKKQKTADEPSSYDALVERIDDMMDIKRPDSKPLLKSDGPIDIFKDIAVETAPPAPVAIETKTAPTEEPVEAEDAVVEIKLEPIITHHALAPEAGVEKVPVAKTSIAPAKLSQSGILDDPKTNKAVDEITKAEGDALFAAQDAAQDAAKSAAKPAQKQSVGSRLKRLFR